MSSSVSSFEKLQDAIDKELSWRKKELALIREHVSIHPCNEGGAFLWKVRSAVALLYAHWEGSIKKIAQKYLEHVFAQNKRYDELRLNFVAVAISGKTSKLAQSEKISIHTQYLTYISNMLSQPIHKLSSNVINTESNLSSKVFSEILITIGIDDNLFKANYMIIDGTLLKLRNAIAHGEIFTENGFDKRRYLELHNTVVNLIDQFSEKVKDAAINETYLKEQNPT